MSLERAILEIQSPELAVRLNVVSSMRAFFDLAREEPAVIELYDHIGKSGEAHEEVLGVIHDLSQLEIDRHYENPHDTSLAILLWLISSAVPDYSQLSADLVDRAPQCWYAKKLARAILFPPPVATGDAWVGEHPQSPQASGYYSGNMLTHMKPPIKGSSRLYRRGAINFASTGSSVTGSAHQLTGKVL